MLQSKPIVQMVNTRFDLKANYIWTNKHHNGMSEEELQLVLFVAIKKVWYHTNSGYDTNASLQLLISCEWHIKDSIFISCLSESSSEEGIRLCCRVQFMHQEDTKINIGPYQTTLLLSGYPHGLTKVCELMSCGLPTKSTIFPCLQVVVVETLVLESNNGVWMKAYHLVKNLLHKIHNFSYNVTGLQDFFILSRTGFCLDHGAIDITSCN